MKIFFLLRHSGYLRNYDSVVRLLAEKGNSVHLGFFKIREDRFSDVGADAAGQDHPF